MKILKCLCALLVIFGCESPFEFDVESEPLLVIDGYLTDNELGGTVVLSRGGNFSDSEIEYEKNARVYVDEIGGTEYDMTEVSPGIYSAPDNLVPKEGVQYQLNVILQDGNHYVSRFKQLPTSNPATIKEISWVIERQKIINENYEEVLGDKILSFFGEINAVPNQTEYLKWSNQFDFQLNTELESPDPLIPTTCYVPGSTGMISKVFITHDSIQNQLLSIDFLEIDFRFAQKLNIKFQLLSMDKESFDYYSLIQQQLESTGSLFDPMPAVIGSDFLNLNDVNEVVLGNFGVFNADVYRLTFNNIDVGYNGTFDVCYPEGTGDPPAFCVDCREYGGASTAIIPDDWFD